MAQVSGVIQQIKTKKVGAKQTTAYDLNVNGQWYGYGFYAPKANEGDYVTFEATQNGNFHNVERGTLKVGKAPADQGKQATGGSVKQAVGSYDARQDAISRQAASNTAIAWLTLLHNAGALPAGSKSKGSQQEALDVIRREYEKEFYESNTGNEWKNIRPGKQEDPDLDIGEDDLPEDEAWQ